MTITATSFPGVVERLTELGDPVRLRLLRLLEREELTVGEVARVLQLPQSTASRHLKALVAGGWLASRTSRTATLHRLVEGELGPEARAIWVAVRGQIEGTAEAEADAERLGDVLAERAMDSRTFFGRVAGEWDAVRAELFGEGFTSAALLGLLRPDWVVADLGCGTGNAAAELAPYVERVIALDESGPMLSAARQRFGASGEGSGGGGSGGVGLGRVECVAGSIESSPLGAGSVDAAVALLVMHHMVEPAGLFREAARVLRVDRGGGVLLVVDMERHGRGEYRHTMGHAHLGFGPEETAAWFAGAGFGRVRRSRLRTGGGAKGPGLFVASGWLGGRSGPAGEGDGSGVVDV